MNSDQIYASRYTLEDLLEMPLEELIELEVSSVSFFDTTARKAPGYSFLIPAEEIEKTSERTLNDIIEMRVPGMTTGGHERHGPLIGTRGVFIDNNAKTMVMLDEQQINQRGHFGYTAGLLSPLLGDLKQVEVILGPGAIVHGSGALNGFINLIPKNGTENPGLFVNTEYGFAEELWKFESGYGISYGADKNIYLYGGFYGAEGYEPDELYGFKTYDFDVHANGFKDPNYRFSLYWKHENLNLNTFLYENNPYKKNSGVIGHFQQRALGIRPKYLFELSSTDSFEFIGSLLWFDHRSPGGAWFINDEILDRGGSENHWDVKNIYRTSRWESHSLAAGFSYGEKSFFQRKQFFSDDADLWMGTLDTGWHELSIFAEDVIALNDSWTASLGLRYDKIYLSNMSSETWSEDKNPDAIQGHFSPRIATAYQLDTDTTLKASYQHGFRTPDAFYYLFHVNYRDAAKAAGLSFPSLDIETMDSYEVNLQKKLPEYKLKVDCNLFYNIFENQLSWKFFKEIGLFTPAELARIISHIDQGVSENPGSILNADEKIKAYGGELYIIYKPLSHSEIKLSYGYVQLENADLVQYPKHQIKLNTLSSFWEDRINLSLSYLYNASYSESDLPNANSIYREDRHVFDTSLTYNVNTHWSIQLSVNNLFENDIPPMVFDPQRLNFGGLGFDERRIYCTVRFSL